MAFAFLRPFRGSAPGPFGDHPLPMSAHDAVPSESPGRREGSEGEGSSPSDLAPAGRITVRRRIEPGRYLLEAERGVLRIGWAAPGLVHLEYARGTEDLKRRAKDGAVVPEFEPHPPDCRTEETRSGLRIRGEELELSVAGYGLAVAARTPHGELLSEDGRGLLVAAPGADDAEDGENSDRRCRLDKRLGEDESIYGLAGACPEFDLIGCSFSSGPRPAGLWLGVRGTTAYGLLFDRAAPLRFDLRPDPERRVSVQTETGVLSVYLVAGSSPGQVIGRTHELTGRTPHPPRWALGLHRRVPLPESADGERPENEERSEGPGGEGDAAGPKDPRERTVRASEEAAFPLDGLILDAPLDRSLAEIARGRPRLRRALDRGRLRVIVRREANEPGANERDTGEPNGSDLSTQLERGAHGFLLDDPGPAVRTLRRAYHDVRRHTSGRRPFVATAGAVPGGHRYAASWLARPLEDRDDLRARVRRCLSLSLSGIPFVGFNPHPARSGDVELLLRGIQTAVLMPLLGIAPPDGTPLGFGLWNEELVRTYRRALHLRYKLVPYLYGLFDAHRRSGRPPLRPLVVTHPDDPTFREETGLFFLGPHLLAASPHTGPDRTDESSIEQTLPAGPWFELRSNRVCDRSLELEEVEPPTLFVRAGAVVPLQPLSGSVRPRSGAPLVLRCYPRGDRTSSIYRDRGDGFAHRSGDLRRLRVTTRSTEDEFDISVARRGDYEGDRRVLEWQIPRDDWTEIHVDGSPIETTRNPELFVRDTDLAYRGRQFLRIRTRPHVRGLRVKRDG